MKKELSYQVVFKEPGESRKNMGPGRYTDLCEALGHLEHVASISPLKDEGETGWLLRALPALASCNYYLRGNIFKKLKLLDPKDCCEVCLGDGV